MDRKSTDSAAVEGGGPAGTRLRVVVAEDDTLLREGLASLLERSDFDVVGQAGDAIDLLTLVREKAPDLVVVDIRMPPTNTTEGLVAARQIRDECPDIGILVLSAHVEVEHAMDLLEGGHKAGYLLKSRVGDVADFIDSLKRIARGGTVVDPELVKDLVSERRRHDPLAVLSTREREVLALMAEGRSNAGIGRELWVAEGTIEKHVSSILTKLNLPETGNDHRRVRAVIAFLEAPRQVVNPPPQGYQRHRHLVGELLARFSWRRANRGWQPATDRLWARNLRRGSLQSSRRSPALIAPRSG